MTGDTMTIDDHDRSPLACMTRRQMLILGGGAVTVLTSLPLGGALAQNAATRTADLVQSRYKPQRIAALKDIKAKTPVPFAYPTADVRNFLVKLGERAGAGVGPDDDIVAFNTVCPHMGGPLEPESYKPEHNVVGPCLLHLSTFDLTKHGMIVSGHASDSLPQIALEIRGDSVFAIGVMGLIYGYARNPVTA